MIKALRVLLPLALVGVLLSCGGGKGRGTGGGRSSVSKASDDIPTSTDPNAHVDHFRFGDLTDADGIVVRERSVLPPDSMVAMSFYVRNVPAGTQVRLVWNDVGANMVKGEEIKPVGDKGFVTFQTDKTFHEGSYRVTMYYKPRDGNSWRMLGTHDFKVGNPS